MAKILVLFSLATGAAMGVLIDALNTSDVALARRLYAMLKPGDVALADSKPGEWRSDFWHLRGLGFGPGSTSRCRVSPTSKS